MAFSEESRQKAAEVRARNREARKQAASVAEAEPEGALPEPESTADAPESEGILSDLAVLFTKASSQKAGRDKAIDDALTLLGSLDPMKYPDLAENPTVQQFVDKVQAKRAESPEVRPGTLMGTGIAAFIKPWSWSDLKKSIDMDIEEVTRRDKAGEICFPWVVYMPIKTTYVGWNGLHVYFRARQRVKVCKVFVDVFEESLNNEEFAEQHAAWMFNAPGVQTNRDFFTTNAPRMKAMDMGKGEYYQPGGGMISLATSEDLATLGS